MIGSIMGMLLLNACSAASIESTFLTYKSYTTDSFAQIFSGSYVTKPSVMHDVRLWLPEEAEQPLPVIVIQHGLSSPDEYGKWLDVALPAYLSAGFAVVMNDSYGARQMQHPKRLSFSARVLDNIMLFNELVKDPRFDHKNINIQGFSYGGMVAYHMAYTAYQPMLNGAWNSHLSMYGACDIILENNQMTGAPVLMYLASGEDYQSNDDCFRYKEQIGGFETYVLENSFHGFALDHDVEYDEESGTFINCDTGPQNTIRKDGTWTYNKKTWSGSYADIISGIWNDCRSLGSTTGGSRETRVQAVADSITFFVQHVAP
ncbi:MAG: hypothetical protein CMM46_14030 [Rhodospirillaceae bacterium]|nr:hypothetical protein [Rhodospirillaceae bacterium]